MTIGDLMNNDNSDYEIVLDTHFSDIAEVYRTIRYTDPDPVYTIESYLDEIVNLKMIDIGS